jgi:hypothetical protein
MSLHSYSANAVQAYNHLVWISGDREEMELTYMTTTEVIEKTGETQKDDDKTTVSSAISPQNI